MALRTGVGKVTGFGKPRHRHQEFLAFLKHVARAYPGQELRLVMDNYAAHKKQDVLDWLAENPRVRAHFTPTSASWMNMVEIWFCIIERQAIHRGTFGSVRELTTKRGPLDWARALFLTEISFASDLVGAGLHFGPAADDYWFRVLRSVQQKSAATRGSFFF